MAESYGAKTRRSGLTVHSSHERLERSKRRERHRYVVTLGECYVVAGDRREDEEGRYRVIVGERESAHGIGGKDARGCGHDDLVAQLESIE